MTKKEANAGVGTPQRTSWKDFTSSPLVLFAGIFSMLEGVILIYLCGFLHVLPALDAARTLCFERELLGSESNHGGCSRPPEICAKIYPERSRRTL